MASHSVAEAKTYLSELIDQAIGGEEVVITRHGTPMVLLKPVARQGRPMTEADLERLRASRATLGVADQDPVSIVERMRDQDLERLLRR